VTAVPLIEYETDCLDELEASDICQVKEASPLSLTLESDDPTIFFSLPEFDDYRIKGSIEDKDRCDNLIYPANQTFHILQYPNDANDQDAQTVPLAPGFYTIRIFCNEHWYYAYWQVTAQHLNQEEWRTMRAEVENKVKGLSLEYAAQKRSHLRHLRDGSVSLYFDDDAEFLNREQSNIRLAVEKLRKDAKFQIKKEYSWVPAGSRAEIDHQTIRMIGERPDKRGQLYSPKRYLEYDITPNRWLKMFVRTIVSACQQQLDYLGDVKTELDGQYQDEHRYWHARDVSTQSFIESTYQRSREEMAQRVAKIHQLFNYLTEVLNDDFLADLKLPTSIVIPKVIMLSPQYNLLYRVYLNLNHDEHHTVIAEYYQRYWKKTAMLYEIWAYIKVLDALLHLDFHPVKGWIYDQVSVLPFLDDGTQVVLENDQLTIQLTYNESLPEDDDQATHERPLMTYARKNKPDIRLDIFDREDRYLGSIVLDSKYKRLERLMRDKSEYGHAGVAEQFRAYKDDPHSPLLRFPSFTQTYAVESVIVLYPSKPSDRDAKIADKNHIYYVQLSPGNDDAINEVLKERIQSVEQRIQMFQWGK
jgi:hypothetical protein